MKTKTIANTAAHSLPIPNSVLEEVVFSPFAAHVLPDQVAAQVAVAAPVALHGCWLDPLPHPRLPVHDVSCHGASSCRRADSASSAASAFPEPFFWPLWPKPAAPTPGGGFPLDGEGLLLLFFCRLERDAARGQSARRRRPAPKQLTVLTHPTRSAQRPTS